MQERTKKSNGQVSPHDCDDSDEIWNKSNFVGCHCKLISHVPQLTAALLQQDIHKNKIEWNLSLIPQASLSATTGLPYRYIGYSVSYRARSIK